MNISFWGAAGEVTGSCYCLEVAGRRILVDCGIYQGEDEDLKNAESLPVAPGEVEAILLTLSLIHI